MLTLHQVNPCIKITNPQNNIRISHKLIFSSHKNELSEITLFKIISMLKLLKKIPWSKFKWHRRNRGADELFLSGKIFEASNKELNNILKEITNSQNTNETIRHREIVRAITVLTIKTNKYTSLIQFFLIILTIFALYLAWKQTIYTEVSTRSERIKQNSMIQQAIRNCEQSPSSAESSLIFIESGRAVSCSEVLNFYKK